MTDFSGNRDVIINALNKTIEVFTSQNKTSFDEIISNGLAPVVDAVKLDRIAVYRLLDKARMGQIYVLANGKKTELDKKLIELPDISFIKRWSEKLIKGKCINGNVKEMDRKAADFCGLFSVKAILLVPVFAHDEFWGVVAFEDHANYRYFDEDCLNLLSSAARLCANAFIQNEIKQNADKAIEELKHREILTRSLNEAAKILLLRTGETFEEIMTLGIRQIVDIVDIDRLSVWRNSKKNDKLYASQVYRWYKAAGGTTEVVKEYINASYYDFAPNWEKILSANESINSPVRLLPEYKLLKTFSMVSLFVTPIFINSDFWGFVLYEDHKNDRFFDKETAGMMRSAAFLCASAVIRTNMEREIAHANELTHAITEASPIPYVLFDEELQPIDCNEAAMQMFASPDKQKVLDKYWEELLPEKQPDGEKSFYIAKLYREDAYTSKHARFRWNHRSFNNEIIPVENTMTHVVHKGKRLIISYKYDLRETNKMLENIREHSELLKIRLEQQELISDISRGFISSGDSEMYIKEAIAKLGNYHKVSHILIFNVDYQKNTVRPAYHWVSDDSQIRLVNIDLIGIIKARFPERLSDCATLPVVSCDDVSSSSNRVYHPLMEAGVRSFIFAPLYVDGRLWGALSVEQCHTTRNWTDNEKSFVTLVAGTIAGVIMRNIYNTMLKDAFEKATTASKAKGVFLSNMSHEMRTPLNAIIGMTAIAKNAEDMERKNYAINKIENASTHLLGVINDVLDMSKIEANKLELASVEFNFEKMLQKAITVITFRVEEKHQKLSLNIDKKIPEFLIGDDQRLTQVITNLLGNAVKFTPENGFVSISASLLGERNDLCTVQISVSDSGIGISKEQQERLFQSFQQAEASTVRKYGGTGLGLAISKNIVEMMGGKIWIESEENKGSVFSFTIPAMRGKGKAASVNERSVYPENIRILVVDDDKDVLEFFKDVSQRYGFPCDIAENADDALKLVKNNGYYDVYFIDWKMPGTDGIALTSAIKSMEQKAGQSEFIIISAAEWSGIKDVAMNFGVNKLLSKPLFPSMVVDIIYECFNVNLRKKDNEQIKEISSFEGHNILLAEDVDLNREIVIAILEPMKLGIDCADNGRKIVELYCENPEKYDLIFMDVQMPEMDGYDATRKIRDFESERKKNGNPLKRIPIIAMTANVFREDIEKCLHAGMDDHLGKPLDFEMVMEKLRTYIK
jgi:signal transduction histidine kinase/DNA-binding response OmpR family regulator/PAS domain-containing protein